MIALETLADPGALTPAERGILSLAERGIFFPARRTKAAIPSGEFV